MAQLRRDPRHRVPNEDFLQEGPKFSKLTPKPSISTSKMTIFDKIPKIPKSGQDHPQTVLKAFGGPSEV